jgi:hypothetical protein
MKSFIAKIFAKWILRQLKKEQKNALEIQAQLMHSLLKQAAQTKFGKDHQFEDIKDYDSFKLQIPVQDYEGLKPYIDEAVAGASDIVWPGRPLYWAKTSGTTSGVKYIPISKQSIKYHINSARNALLCYIAESGNANFINGKLIFLSGSPEMEKKNGVFTGRLSGIVNHHVPGYLRTNQLPSYETNCIEDWEQKVAAIADETIHQPMSLISGIPPWVQMYFDLLMAKTGKSISEIFPQFSVFVYGGVNFEPYRQKIEKSIGKKIDSIETYPASEGFIAFQDSQADKALLLQVNNGIFYEFIPVDEFYNENPTRVSLAGVELNKNYVLILNTNAGLFGYNIGDTIKFVSIQPYKILVTGRLKHFISAFGEHVIGEEVEQAILKVAEKYQIEIIEFTVAPQVNPAQGLPYHEWFVEFAEETNLPSCFEEEVDALLCQKNTYYNDLIQGGILKKLHLNQLKKGAFISYMKTQGKLGGQNKVPRLSNNRAIADQMIAMDLIK